MDGMDILVQIYVFKVVLMVGSLIIQHGCACHNVQEYNYYLDKLSIILVYIFVLILHGLLMKFNNVYLDVLMLVKQYLVMIHLVKIQLEIVLKNVLIIHMDILLLRYV